jgi:succinate-semialdehyde dehydrogenase / glutarate-semialdehyde dehydrogenase
MAPEKVNSLLFEGSLRHVTHVEEVNEWIPVRAPYSGEILGRIPAGGAADVQLAVARARGAQPAWAARSFADRAQVFLRFHDLLLERQAEVLDIIQWETGKARRHAFEEVLDTAIVARYYALHAGAMLRPRRRRGALPLLTKAWEFHAPIGVVGFIMPWNYPLNLAITDAVAALMAGNTGVLKPDPQASFTALWAVALLREAGLPPDVLPVVTGEGPIAGSALADAADFLMFTGGTATGRVVAQKAAGRLIGCSLELGGKNPMLVFADADLDAAVDGAVRGCFVGAGQVCVSIERIYVEAPVFERFVSRFAERTKKLAVGAALDFSMDVGCLTSERQLSVVRDHVGDAVAKGAEVIAGGRDRPDLGPLFYEPTILTGVRPEMKVYAEETFGPVVSIYRFSSEEQAIELANATRYGLSASVWTRDTGRGVGVARRIRAGSVNVNEAYAATWGSVDSPVGGRKDSGMRPRHGLEGLLKYTETQTVAVQRLLPVGPRADTDAARYARWMTRLLSLVRWTRVLG